VSDWWRAAIPAAVVLLLASCNVRPLFLFFLDPYTAQLEPGLAEGKRPTAQSLEPEFRTAAVVRPLGAEAQKELGGLLAGRRPSVVYLSPLFNLDPDRLLAEFPQTTFVRPGRPVSGAGWVAVNVDHQPAMRAAGRVAARVAERAGRGGAGILVAGSAPWLQERVAAFREGFSGEGGAAELLYRQIDGANDRVRARQLLEEMRQEGAGVFVLLTYSLTGFCLEYLQKQGALAVAQDPAAAAAFPDAVLLYLEEDTAEELRAVRDLLMEAAAAGEGTAPRVITVAVRLRAGPALQGMPPEILAGLQGIIGGEPQ